MQEKCQLSGEKISIQGRNFLSCLAKFCVRKIPWDAEKKFKLVFTACFNVFFLGVCCVNHKHVLESFRFYSMTCGVFLILIDMTGQD